MSVFWTRGYRREGNALHLGVVVVRPGWVAFLPLGTPLGPMGQFQLGAARGMAPGANLRMDVPWQGKYPIMAWWQHGLHVLDEEVRRALAQPGAFMMTTQEGGLVTRKFIPAAFASTNGALWVTLDQRPPPDLLAPWPPGVMPFDKKKMTTAIAILSATFVLLGAGCEALIVSQEGSWHPFPFVFFGFLLLLTLGGFAMRIREHEKELAAQQQARAVGPYR